ncbi:hypothetical protein [Mycobacterium sp.]|uniref:hypothetical protein n=1 Tax=Mycobacterium sp. TaxID=1785 RepID=UPI003BB15BC9
MGDVAGAAGLRPIYDSGPCFDGKLVIFADEQYADDYLHRKASAGTRVEVTFGHDGTVARASKFDDDECTAHVSGVVGSGERLLWTLQMFAVDDELEGADR